MTRHALTNQVMRRVFADSCVMKRFVKGMHYCMKNMGDSYWKLKDLLMIFMDVLFRVAHNHGIRAVKGKWDLVSEMCLIAFRDGVSNREYFPCHFFMDIVERMCSSNREDFDGANVGKELRSVFRNGVYICVCQVGLEFGDVVIRSDSSLFGMCCKIDVLLCLEVFALLDDVLL